MNKFLILLVLFAAGCGGSDKANSKNAIFAKINSSGKITDEQAEILSKEKFLSLNDLTSITDEQANILSKVEEYLYLNGLTSITDEQAESLSKVKDLGISAACQPLIAKYKK